MMTGTRMTFSAISLPGNLSIESKTKSITLLEMNIEDTQKLSWNKKNTKGTRDPGHDKTKASKIPITSNVDTNNRILSSQSHNNQIFRS